MRAQHKDTLYSYENGLSTGTQRAVPAQLQQPSCIFPHAPVSVTPGHVYTGEMGLVLLKRFRARLQGVQPTGQTGPSTSIGGPLRLNDALP